jgi:hypothetical protein
MFINGALYLFPNDIDNNVLNKRFLAHNNIISPSANDDATGIFLRDGISILLPGAYKDEVMVSCNTWHPGMDALILYAFLEQDIYINVITEALPTRKNYIYVRPLRGYSGRDVVSDAAAKGYYLVREIEYYDERFYFFRKINSFNYAGQEDYHAFSDNTVL